MDTVKMKTVLLGNKAVGKTCLVRRFIDDTFTETGTRGYQTTIGAAFVSKRMSFHGRCVEFNVWDTAGEERFKSMSAHYYRGASAAVVCYDLTDMASFRAAQEWVRELRNNVEDCRIYLCGTKLDLIEDGKREIDPKMVNNVAYNIQGFATETSSRTSENVFELFDKIATDEIAYGQVLKDESQITTLSPTSVCDQVGCCR